MHIVIDISEEEYEDVKNAGGCYYDFGKAIVNGIPIPDNATSGDVIKALFPNFEYIERDYLVIVKDGYYQKEFSMDWWNAPYKSGSEG